MIKYLFLFFTLLHSILVIGQVGVPDSLKYDPSLDMYEVEERLVKLVERMRECTDPECQSGRNIHIVDFLTEAFKRPDEMMTYPFEGMTKLMSILKSEDKKLRLFNWNYEHQDRTQEYYCFILYNNNNTYEVIELRNRNRFIFNAELKKLNEHKWFGALYTDIATVKIKKKTYYTLLGWDGFTALTNRKVIDVLQINNGKAIFGETIFKSDDGMKRRIVLAYKKEAACALNYEKKNNAIVFDDLIPMHPYMEGAREFYIGSGAYNAYIWDGKNWLYVSDYDAKNPKSSLDKYYNAPKGGSKKDIEKRHKIKLEE